MLEIRFDPAWVEEVVFLELNRLTVAGGRQAVSSFHRQREAVYELQDAQQRDTAFRQWAHRTFEALGLADLFRARLSEFPRVSARVELVVVRGVWSRRDEQVELYGGRPGEARPTLEVATTLLIGLQAIRCLDRGRMVALLRHELMHVADMCDPAFAYHPHPALGGECGPENELIRERFRVLWDLWVHARVRRCGWQTLLDDEVRRRETMRAFAFLKPSARQELISAVSRQDRWTQGELLALAQEARFEVAR